MGDGIRLRVAAAIGLLFCLHLFRRPAPAEASVATARPDDPVVLKGSDVSRLNGISPNLLVAFRWTGSAWDQVPVQVDERKTINVRNLYPASGANSGYVTGTNTGFDLEVYADSGTRSGADTDLTVDENDEIVFMAGDSGEQKDSWPVPEGVVLGSGVKVNLTDPVTDEDSWVYLYRSQGSLDPSAGEQYVDYDPVLNLAGRQLQDQLRLLLSPQRFAAGERLQPGRFDRHHRPPTNSIPAIAGLTTS